MAPAGRLVYEWDQSLDEVNLYIDPPPGLSASQFDIEIKSDHLMVGIKGNRERYLNVSPPSTLPPAPPPAPTRAAPPRLDAAQPVGAGEELGELLDGGGRGAAHHADQA